MANPSQYYVPPGGSLRGLADIGAMVAESKENRRLKEEKERNRNRIELARQEAVKAVQSKDPDKMYEIAVKYPEFSAAVRDSAQYYNKKIEKNYINSAIGFLSNPTEENLREIITGTRDLKVEEGAPVDVREDIEKHVEAFRNDPEGVINEIEMGLVFGYHKQWKAWKEAAGKDGIPTSAQEFEYYNTLLRENPAKAAEYATQVGIAAKPSDDRTTAIKEFEYGEKNPKFKLAQKAKADAQKTKDVKGKTFEDSSKLRKEFLAQSKEYQKVRDAYTRVVNSTKDPSPAGDLSLIFNYMKMLDPGSVVRESEFATAASSGSFGERIQAATQKVLSGERLSPNMRADFVKKSGALMEGMQKQHMKREANYTGIAGKNGLPVDEVVVDITAPAEGPDPTGITPKYTEGQTATGPGGQKIIFRNGNWEAM